jgi:cell division protein FtsX
MEEVTSKLELMLWMNQVDEIVGLGRKIGSMILMHLGLLVWLLVKFSQRLSDLAKLRY